MIVNGVYTPSRISSWSTLLHSAMIACIFSPFLPSRAFFLFFAPQTTGLDLATLRGAILGQICVLSFNAAFPCGVCLWFSSFRLAPIFRCRARVSGHQMRHRFAPSGAINARTRVRVYTFSCFYTFPPQYHQLLQHVADI